MNNYKIRKLSGLLYTLAGIMLLVWSSAIVVKVLIFFIGLLLLNNGLQLLGYASLWSYGSVMFFNRQRFF